MFSILMNLFWKINVYMYWFRSYKLLCNWRRSKKDKAFLQNQPTINCKGSVCCMYRFTVIFWSIRQFLVWILPISDNWLVTITDARLAPDQMYSSVNSCTSSQLFTAWSCMITCPPYQFMTSLSLGWTYYKK